MVRIRKKTSNRASTAHRAKVKHKARETKKKTKKDAKKNPHLHRKKKQKDPGIPNSFPFKEGILAELAESRRLAIEQKRSKDDSKRSNGASDGHNSTKENTQAKGTVIKEAISVTTGRGVVELDEAPLLIDTTIPNTAAALQVADVVISVLDARDPLSYRSTYIEGTLGNTPLLYVLNKIDLVPRESMASWVTHLRQSHPTFLFRSASSYLPADPQASQSKSKSKPSTSDCLGRDVLLEALHTIAGANSLSELTVAVVGVTNVGKSAFISSLLGQPALAVYNPLAARDASAPSTTPHPQSITLSHKKRTFKLVDTPGLSFIPPSESTSMEDPETRIARDVLLRNRGNISKIKDPLPAALYILSRAVMEDMILLYNLPAVRPGDYDGFLASLARKEGALQKRGAIVDFQGAAKALVRDWKTGRFAYYTLPPPTGSNLSTQTTSKLPSLTTVFAKSDERMMSEILTRKELRKRKTALVQLRGAVPDERRVDLEATVDLMEEDDSEDDVATSGKTAHPEEMELTDDEDEDDFSADDDEDESEGDSGSEEDGAELDIDSDDDDEDDDDDDDDEEASPSPVPVAPPKLSGKKGRELLRAGRESGKETSASKKNVSFAPYTKAGMKMKTAKPAATNKTTIAPKSGSVKASALGNTANVSKASRKGGSGVAQADGDAYDFSKYF